MNFHIQPTKTLAHQLTIYTMQIPQQEIEDQSIEAKINFAFPISHENGSSVFCDFCNDFI